MWTERERDGYNRFTSLHHSSLLLECVCAHVCACACTCVHMSTCKKLTCFPLLIHTKLGHMLTQLLLSSLVILHFPLSLTPFPTPPRHFSPPHPPKSGFLSTFTTQNYWTTHLRADQPKGPTSFSCQISIVLKKYQFDINQYMQT